MNFFPNLQIIFNVFPSASPLPTATSSFPDSSPVPPLSSVPVPVENVLNPASSSSTSTSSTSTSTNASSPTVSQIIQRILRPSAPITQVDDGNGAQNDMHFYVNLDSIYPPVTGLTVEQIHDRTTLQVFGSSTSILCTICQNPCEPGSIVQTIEECHHVFHPVCIERWLVQNNSCPVCRSVVAPLPTLQNNV